jgi:hypothetical protein
MPFSSAIICIQLFFTSDYVSQSGAPKYNHPCTLPLPHHAPNLTQRAASYPRRGAVGYYLFSHSFRMIALWREIGGVLIVVHSFLMVCPYCRGVFLSARITVKFHFCMFFSAPSPAFSLNPLPPKVSHYLSISVSYI